MLKPAFSMPIHAILIQILGLDIVSWLLISLCIALLFVHLLGLLSESLLVFGLANVCTCLVNIHACWTGGQNILSTICGPFDLWSAAVAFTDFLSSSWMGWSEAVELLLSFATWSKMWSGAFSSDGW
jgi:hypothetical protein